MDYSLCRSLASSFLSVPVQLRRRAAHPAEVRIKYIRILKVVTIEPSDVADIQLFFSNRSHTAIENGNTLTRRTLVVGV